MATTADSDVPPLEDMSAVLHNLQHLNVNSHSTTGSKSTSHTPVQPPDRVVKSEDKLIEAPQSGDVLTCSSKPEKVVSKPKTSSKSSNSSTPGAGFGGLQKGFLFGGPSSSSSAKSPPSDDMPFIKKRETQSEPLRMPEVEAAMKSTQTLLNKGDWVTESLLEKVAGNPTLTRNLSKPEFAQALGEFQTNPQAAMAKYQHNSEVQQVFKEFCQLLGDHFSGMSEDGSTPTEPQPTSQHLTPIDPEQARVNEILNDPETRELLMDPDVQNIIGLLKNDPHNAQRFISQANRDLKVKINKLINMGLLQMQPM